MSPVSFPDHPLATGGEARPWSWNLGAGVTGTPSLPCHKPTSPEGRRAGEVGTGILREALFAQDRPAFPTVLEDIFSTAFQTRRVGGSWGRIMDGKGEDLCGDNDLHCASEHVCESLATQLGWCPVGGRGRRAWEV